MGRQSKTTNSAKLTDLGQPFSVKQLLDLYDCFYVCFDEPNRRENWSQISKSIPQAKIVTGVVGFDQALKACAKKSKTPYFFLIDGDNQILPERLNNSFSIPEVENDWVISWSALNTLNGLNYGNGGLKLWPKSVALSIRSHENVEDHKDPTDYCFIAKYYLVDDFVTKTVVNKTPVQAFRAGFREGVKMSLGFGYQQSLNRENFEKQLGPQNRERLKVWCEVGLDQPFGIWAIWGARAGFYLNLIEMFEYQNINFYEWIDSYFLEKIQEWGLKFSEIHLKTHESPASIEAEVIALGERLNERFPLQLTLKTAQESADFKKNFKNPPRGGLLL